MFLVKDIDDNEFASNPLAQTTFAGKEIYNFNLISIINPSAVTTDTLEINNYINFISTVPKKSKAIALQNQIEVIKSLKSGDTVFVNGSITYINTQLKIDFEDVVNEPYGTNIDILLNSIKKKNK